MPKERRDRSVSRDRCRASPYPCSSNLKKWSAELEDNAKEWEEARCPVCMEHPHNAVLLICSSHHNGCRPYMCDTSYRHSNCLDQFRKSFSPDPDPDPDPDPVFEPVPEPGPELEQEPEPEPEPEPEISSAPVENPAVVKVAARIMCPLCRGEIKEWTVVEPARRFMNAKPRSCSCEKCSFSGAYAELRRHARDEHPGARPTEADPARERSWRRLERQRDLGDLLSTLQSSMAAAGDENSSSVVSDDGEAAGGEIPIDDGRWLTVFFLIRVFRSPGSSSRSSSWSGPPSRTRAQLSIRRRSSRLWGESYEEEPEEEEEDEEEEATEATETGSSSRGREENIETSSEEGPGDGRRRSERIRRRTSASAPPDENQP